MAVIAQRLRKGFTVTLTQAAGQNHKIADILNLKKTILDSFVLHIFIIFSVPLGYNFPTAANCMFNNYLVPIFTAHDLYHKTVDKASQETLKKFESSLHQLLNKKGHILARTNEYDKCAIIFSTF